MHAPVKAIPHLKVAVLLIMATLMLSGCDAAMAIFEVGWWMGLIVAAIVVAAVWFVASKAKR